MAVDLKLLSIAEIYNFLMEQAAGRSPENDEQSVLIETAAFMCKQMEDL